MAPMSILTKLEDLRQKAMTEQSHFYVAQCCSEAIAEIIRLQARLENQSRSAEFRLSVRHIPWCGWSWLSRKHGPDYSVLKSDP